MADYIREIRSLVGHTKIIMVACGALVFDGQGRILLHKRGGNGYWGLPGSYLEIGGIFEDAARREVLEETGLRLGKMVLFGIYSGVKNEWTHPNGDQVANVLIEFICRDYEGELAQTTEESLDVRFFPLEELPVKLFPGQKEIFENLLSSKLTPIIS
ncbi:NUDIX hydrolase [Alicyclobacillus suci]|uniref:NUDIX hydrolase n=1 Tax=Alicyclobacillus suci TaxID=2816080 RepID=UPI002E286D80|nr:NUDIX domain-containing protein [Alicyclobacillus suci]